MKNIEGRLNKLESHLGVGRNAQRFIVSITDRDIALPLDECVKILEEDGFLHPAARVVILNFRCMPRDLNAKDAEKFVREHGAEICGGHPGPRGSSAVQGVEAVDGGSGQKMTDTIKGRLLTIGKVQR